jgi:O-acetylhomoserine/O-acetylserine sulfhydrylase-like pyridoxal-dependent enzyme
MHIETLAVHAGRRTDPATGAIVSPISLSTTFERARDGGIVLDSAIPGRAIPIANAWKSAPRR